MQSTPLDNSFSTKPEVGLDLRIKNGLIIFSYRAINYVIRSQPDEPCTYIGRGEENLHTLHSGFKTCDIEKMILKDKQFVSVDKRLIGRDALLQIFAAVIDDGRKEMGFDEAERLGLMRPNKQKTDIKPIKPVQPTEIKEKTEIKKKIVINVKTEIKEKIEIKDETETMSCHDFIGDGVLAWGVDVGRFVFKKNGKVVYTLTDLPHVVASDVLFCYQISRVVYDFLIAKSLPHRIPKPPVPPSITNRYHNIFLCSESAYAKRNEFTLKDVDLSLCDDCPVE